jgi:hypothetical protein
MNTSIQAELDGEDVSFAPEGTEFFHGGGRLGGEPEENAAALQPRPQFGVSAIRLAASSAASIWQRDDPMPSVAEFFRVLQQCWRRS